MNFNRSDLLIYIIPLAILIIGMFLKSDISFFRWIKKYWFVNRSVLSKISSVLFFIGLFILFLSLADLRGKEKLIKGKVAENKTIILIDSSASMLAEDVRPNRFQKALLLAKHYLKKAVGQQVSIVVFSDKQKRIVPFTTDMNLLEARLGTLEDINLINGGSNISLALAEAEKYFISQNGISVGNILLITDGEESSEEMQIKLDDNITLGVIAVGTAKGSTIPLRDTRGVSRGNKRHNGKPVITKLDEGYLKSLGQNINNYRFWITSSYSLPTEEVLNYFSKTYQSKVSKGQVRIKPVLAEYLIIPAIILLILSYILKMNRSFVYSLIFLMSFNVHAQPQGPGEQKSKEKSEKIKQLETKFAKGDITELEKKYLAQKLLDEGFFKEAKDLYSEVLDSEVNTDNKEEYLNKGVAEFKSGDFNSGIQSYNKLLDHLKNRKEDKELYAKVKKNLLHALQQQEQQKKQQSKENKNNQKENKNNKDQQQNSNQNQNQNQDQKQDSNQNQKNDDQNKDQQKNKDQNKKEQNKKDKEKNKGKDKDKEKKEDKGDKGKKDKKDDENQKNGKKKKKKIPALLKQLMSDDNQLQKKMIDAQTKERKTRDKKDW